MMHDIALVLKAFHPQFLLLTPACFVLGWALAVASGGGVESGWVLLSFIGALAAHVSVNGFNEYFDYRSGLDTRTQKTPFSGGSGVLQVRSDLAPWILALASVAFGVALMAGSILTWESQSILLFGGGILGLFLVVAYTPWLTRSPFFCLIAPGLGFGLLIVGGIAFVLSGEISPATWIGSFITFCVVNNLLLLNQYPDVEADMTVGRAHFPIAYGLRKSTLTYGLFAGTAFSLLIFAERAHLFPIWALLGCIPFFSVPFIISGLFKNERCVQKIVFLLGWNVFIAVGTPILIALGFWVASLG